MTSDKDKEKANEFLGCVVFVVLVCVMVIALCAATVAVRWAF